RTTSSRPRKQRRRGGAFAARSDCLHLRGDTLLERTLLDLPQRRRIAESFAERREILAWWAGSRLLVLGGALALYWLREPRGYFGHAIFRHPLGALEAWDGIWYRVIARHGYLLVPGRQSDPAFFPLHPLLLKVLGSIGLP